MSDRAPDAHPDPQRLGRWRDGDLADADAAGLAAHVADCPLCRLELRRLELFAASEPAPAALAEAGWDGAELALQRAFREQIAPALAPARRGRRAARLVWLGPVAAAAALALFLVARPERGPLPTLTGGPDTPRGGPAAASALAPLAPTGELAAAPDTFRWRDAAAHEAWTLTVYTPQLETVLSVPGLTAPVWAVPDSLRPCFVPGRTYLWNVEGRRGLGARDLSPNAWFRIAPRAKEGRGG